MSPSRDDLLIQRYVDGELSDADEAVFAARLLREPALRKQVDDLERLSSRIVAAPPLSATAGFTADVLVRARRLPARDELEQMDFTSGAARLCLRLFLAAALIFGFGVAWHAGLVVSERASTLEAAPATIEHEMDRLDQLILQSMEAPLGGK